MHIRRSRTYKLFRETPKKFLNVTTALVMVATSLGSALPVLLTQQAAAAAAPTSFTGSDGPFSLSMDCEGGNVVMHMSTDQAVQGWWDGNAYYTVGSTTQEHDLSSGDHDVWTLPTGNYKTTAGSTNVRIIGFYGFFQYYDHTYSVDYPALNCDTVKPTVSFTSATNYPVPNSYHNGSFDVKWAVHDDRQLKSVGVSLFDTNPAHANHWVATCYNNAAETTADDAGTCTITLPSLAAAPDGTYYVQVGAQDEAGNWSVNQTRTVYLDRTAPVTTSVTAVSSAQNVNLTAGTNSNDSNVVLAGKQTTFTVNLNDGTGSGSYGAYIELFKANYDGSYGTWKADNTSGTNVRYGSTPKLTANLGNYPGNYGLKVVSRDTLGNSTTKYYFFAVDNQSPTASFTSQVPQYVNGNFAVSGVANDNHKLSNVFFDVRGANGWVAGCVAGTTVLAYTNAQKDATTSCTINTANLADGTYTLRIHASDYANYGGGESRTIVVDKTAPVVAITAPNNGDTLHGTVAVSGTVTDTNPDHYYFVVKDAHGKVVAGPRTVDQANVASWSWDTTKVADGTYTIDLEARDKADNKAASSVQTITVTVDNTAPAVTVSTLSTTDTTPALSGTVDDSSIPVVVTVNGHDYTALVSSTANVQGTYDWTVDVTDGLSLGTYDVTATATDLTGNAGRDNTANELTITALPTPTVTPLVTTTAARFATSRTSTPQSTSNSIANPGTVLGDSTTTPSSDDDGSNGKVKGASTVKIENASGKKSNDFLFLGWWWFAILAALAAFWLFILRRRNSEN